MIDSLRSFLETSISGRYSPEIVFLSKLISSALSCSVIGALYKRYGRTVSDRNTIALSVVYLGVVTTFIISVVQSSIALSLGLVGSLSIVRFRTPVKEPEELLILFSAIGIGVGFGAGEPIRTLIALVVIVIVIFCLNLKKTKLAEPGLLSLHLNFRGDEPDLPGVIRILEKGCIKIDLIRMDYKEGFHSLSFHLIPKDVLAFDEAQKDLRRLNSTMATSFIDYQPLQ